ncbi:MAG TPA: molybdopterin-dependent oxidoreductase [Candidatus Brocadiales bacterium]|nr:molybdopterin-dependent oxidoreductase [Candidatus Brocadiales bacterium]
MEISRRDFLRYTGMATGGAMATGLKLRFLEAQTEIPNPLEHYPDRNWEKVYRDQYYYDRTFTFCCVPNDTHNCRLKAFVRNGVVTRIEQNYDSHLVEDLHGNKCTPMWNPRGCLKGYTLVRRVYGPYRIKYPMVRKGWMEWAENGFPDPNTPENQEKYFQRDRDTWVRASWDYAFTLVAKGLLRIMSTYGGEEGAKLLRKQGYPEEMIEAAHGTGARCIKIRPGMGFLGMTRIYGSVVRFCNMLGLYDGKGGARNWSNYTWHGDLGPGHPMVSGIQTFDSDLNDFRHAKLMVFSGKNMVENKMPDAHWWIEIMERGGKIVNISPEYSPASQKADYWVPVRPGSDVALMMGVVHLLIKNNWYEVDFVKQYTDLPLLVRLDNLKILRAADIISGYKNKELTGYSKKVQIIDPQMREEWGDFVVWDTKSNSPKVITREDVGKHLAAMGIDPALEGSFKVKTTDGKEIEVKPSFQLYKELCAEYDPATVQEITSTPKEMIEQLAKDFATIKPAMIHTGEGTNHYFHCDIKDRVNFLILALTGNFGKPGGGPGHWAGNYKISVFPGSYVMMGEDPFHVNLDPNAKVEDIKVKKYFKPEEVCYWNYQDNILKVKGKSFTGQTHMPTPTKAIWFANVNLINNAKWAYEMVYNTNKRVEMIVAQDWEWTGSCEVSDIVFPVHSWMELIQPDFTASCSNPFLQVWKGGIKPLYDTKQDSEIYAGVACKLAELTGDNRYRDYWKFILEGKTEIYIQRMFDACITTQGYKADELLKQDRGALMLFRTYPRITGWEQIQESKPFYNKTGRLEFYRDEDEFIEYGENLIVFREPVEATPYLPNVIVATHSAIRPNDYGIPLTATSADERSVRNVKMSWKEVKKTKNFLWEKGYRFYCLTPKTRHTVHSSWSNSDWNLIWASNYGDPYRMDKRTPGVGEHQIHLNPEDARELGINDGDYVYADANPDDRPYVGWKPDDPNYKVARLMLRVKYNPAYPRGVTMMKHSAFMSLWKTVKAHETRADGRAVTADTGYQSNFRYGSQQSLTRGWLQPTMMTDSLVRKNILGQGIGKGFEIDVHAPNTCPKETLIRICKAEDGGIDGRGSWEPARTGLTPAHENEAMKNYLAGKFIT